jgi:hypothetical protein
MAPAPKTCTTSWCRQGPTIFRAIESAMALPMESFVASCAARTSCTRDLRPRLQDLDGEFLGPVGQLRVLVDEQDDRRPLGGGLPVLLHAELVEQGRPRLGNLQGLVEDRLDLPHGVGADRPDAEGFGERGEPVPARVEVADENVGAGGQRVGQGAQDDGLAAAGGR